MQEAERLLEQLAGLLGSLQPALAEYARLQPPSQPLALSVLAASNCAKGSRLRDSQHPVVKVCVASRLALRPLPYSNPVFLCPCAAERWAIALSEGTWLSISNAACRPCTGAILWSAQTRIQPLTEAREGHGAGAQGRRASRCWPGARQGSAVWCLVAQLVVPHQAYICRL